MIVIVAILICCIVVAIAIGYTALLLTSFPDTDISDELRPYEKTIGDVTGWDINAMGGYPVLIDGFNPTWVKRTVRKSGVLSDITTRYDTTCSDAVKEEIKRRGTSMADAKLRAVPCEGDSSKRCVRIPFHLHLHGSYVENRYAANGSTVTYRGLISQDWFENPFSVVAKNPIFGASEKVHVDMTKGTPPVLNFPPAPELPEKTKKLDKLAGMCADPSYLATYYGEDNRKYKFSKGMERPFTLMLTG